MNCWVQSSFRMKNFLEIPRITLDFMVLKFPENLFYDEIHFKDRYWKSIRLHCVKSCHCEIHLKKTLHLHQCKFHYVDSFYLLKVGCSEQSTRSYFFIVYGINLERPSLSLI